MTELELIAIPQMDLLADGWVHLVDPLPGWEGFSVDLKADLVNGEPRIVGLRLEPNQDQGVTLTGNRLRTFPVTALAAAVYHWRDLKPATVSELVDALTSAREALMAQPQPKPDDRRKVTTVEAVAKVYRTALASGSDKGTRKSAPRAAVCEALKISPRTADRYISQARRQGLIPAYGDSEPS